MTMTASRNKKVYYSDIQGTLIKDAITGEILPWKVGSFDEVRLFKVKDNSLLNKFDSTYQESHTMYFKSPHEYMEFNSTNLDLEIIENWTKRQEKLTDSSSGE